MVVLAQRCTERKEHTDEEQYEEAVGIDSYSSPSTFVSEHSVAGSGLAPLTWQPPGDRAGPSRPLIGLVTARWLMVRACRLCLCLHRSAFLSRSVVVAVSEAAVF